MTQPRASHSIVLTSTLRYVYAFGGVDLENQALKSIERIRINNVLDPTKDLNTAWQLLDLQLNEPVMNLGCLMLANQKDILLFGGVSGLGDQLSSSFIFSIDQEDRGIHKLVQGQSNLEAGGDTFPNCGAFIKNGDDCTLVGAQNVWNVSTKTMEISKILAVQLP